MKANDAVEVIGTSLQRLEGIFSGNFLEKRFHRRSISESSQKNCPEVMAVVWIMDSPKGQKAALIPIG